jgi:hypothetical protein
LQVLLHKASTKTMASICGVSVVVPNFKLKFMLGVCFMSVIVSLCVGDLVRRHMIRDVVPLTAAGIVPCLAVGVLGGNVRSITAEQNPSDNWIIVQSLFAVAMMMSLGTILVVMVRRILIGSS